MSLRSPSASAASSSLQLSLVALDDPADRVALATRWRALEARAEGSFFTRWAWIGTWLALLPDAVRPRLLQARRGERDVGLAQIEAGLAWHFRRYAAEQPAARRQAFEQAEQRARRRRAGLWQDATPVAPWQYREQARINPRVRAPA